MDKTPFTLEAVEKLKAKGVTAIKVELEANSGRDTGSEEDCLRFILDELGENYDFSEDGYNEYHDDSHHVFNPLPWMKFAMFYYDGSVDSEMTFTVKLDDPNNVFKIEKVIEAFKSCMNYYGELSTRGAGMHMALVFDRQYEYPASNTIREQSLINFKRAMKQYLPALYFLGSPDGNTRNLDFRRPNISIGYYDDYRGNGSSWDNSYKYSAIYYHGNAMEFRVFDPCYGDVSVVYDYIQVMTNSIRYLSPTYFGPSIGKKVGVYSFGKMFTSNVNDLYKEEVHVDLLNAGLKALKPSYYSIKDVKRQRNFSTTKVSIRKQRKAIANLAKVKYQEYLDRFEYSLKAYEHMMHGQLLDSIVNILPIEKLRELDDDTLASQVAEKLKLALDERIKTKTPETNFIDNFVTTETNNLKSDWRIDISAA